MNKHLAYLHNITKEIHNLHRILLQSDKTENLYRLTKDYYLEFLKKEIQKHYRITSKSPVVKEDYRKIRLI